MTQLFGNVDVSNTEEQQDRLAGGTFTVESGIYDATVKLMYMVPSASTNAKCLMTVFDINGVEHTERQWVLNKNGEATYEKNGKSFMLPGFEAMNDLCLMATGFGLGEQEFQDKVIKVWDGQERKEVEKNMPVAVNLLGKTVKVGIVKVKRNKQKKGNDNQYYDTNEVVEENEIQKYFHAETGYTLLEFKKSKQGVQINENERFSKQWTDANEGKVIDRFKQVDEAPSSGASGGSSGSGMPSNAAGGSGGGSLFSN